MKKSLGECRSALTNIQSYRRHFLMMTKATVTSSKTVEVSFRGPLGFRARTVLLAVDSDAPNQFAFESVGGNIDLMGLIDFAEVMPHCTEITLALHYEIKNRLFAWLDRRLHFVDVLVNAELRSIREHLETIAMPYREHAPILPIFEPAAAA
jgi:ribosome-associated toxin RatA of RatAB toxin-antitoxin module